MLNKIILVSLFLPLAAMARSAETSGKWNGAGTTFDASGQEVGQFVVHVTNTSSSDDTLDSEAVITLPGGQTETFHQHFVFDGDHFTLQNDSGKGGGRCFGEGLCQSYVGDEKHGVATTIIYDSAKAMRLLSTELDNGKAVHFIRQRLTKE